MKSFDDLLNEYSVEERAEILRGKEISENYINGKKIVITKASREKYTPMVIKNLRNKVKYKKSIELWLEIGKSSAKGFDDSYELGGLIYYTVYGRLVR